MKTRLWRQLLLLGQLSMLGNLTPSTLLKTLESGWKEEGIGS
nr:hypothetical protein [Evansella caseinilytica]